MEYCIKIKNLIEISILDQTGKIENLTKIEIYDNNLKIWKKWKFDKNLTIW